MSVKWAFIGAGRQASLRLAPGMQLDPNSEILGVWSTPYETAVSFAETFGAQRVYSTIEEALADRDVQAVAITTPNSLHAEHSIKAARAGKHVLVEKPFALTIEEAQAAVEAAEKAGVLLGAGFHLRHHLLHQEAKQMIEAGEIGQIVYATGNYSLYSFTPDTGLMTPWKKDLAMSGGSGSLYGMGVHVIDLMHYFLGQKPIAVTAMHNADPATRPSENLAMAIVHYDGGAFAYLSSSSCYPFGKNDVALYGSKGRIVGEGTINMPSAGRLEVTHHLEEATLGIPETSKPLYIQRLIQDYVLDATGTSTTVVERPLPDSYGREIEAFSRAVKEGGKFHADGIDGLHSVQVSAAILESARTGRTVAID
jgi:1,5-anhydro-D-fructose reductase (1,5-anhydro-D-mannitol-forming)